MKPSVSALLLIVLIAAGGAGCGKDESEGPKRPMTDEEVADWIESTVKTQPASALFEKEPAVRFFGLTDRADHVVYLIEGGGSLLDAQDDVRRELLRSLGRLGDNQTFHIIYFSSTSVREGPLRGLAPAGRADKLKALEFLRGVRPGGQAEVLPACQRAFEVLAEAPAEKPAKVIYLVMFGELLPNEKEKVIETFRARSAAGGVRVHTILLWHKVPPAMAQLRRIAADSGGKYKFVQPQ